MIQFSVEDSTKGTPNITYNPLENKYTLFYPCIDNTDCTDYKFKLNPGYYRFELYGASGGSPNGRISMYKQRDGTCIPNELIIKSKGNAICRDENSRGGAGGYTSGIIRISESTTAYATIGGHGSYEYKIKESNNENCFKKENMIPGGYGYGGFGGNWYSATLSQGSGGGGGQTSIQFLENDLWHRVIVSGGGGAGDSPDGEYLGYDDGSGGSGGGLQAQGWWNGGQYVDTLLANSTFGFSFGYGESGQYKKSKSPNSNIVGYGSSDRVGAGGGWFGGFSSQHQNGGAGGGSSFILTKNAIIPQEEIPAYDSFYNFIDNKTYYFINQNKFLFTDEINIPGVWEGSGKIIITYLNFLECQSNIIKYLLRNHLFWQFLNLGLDLS